MTITQERLAEIKARCDAATPGPWSDGEGVPYSALEELRVCGWDRRPVPSGNDYYACGPRVACSLSAVNDSRFISNARSDVPALLAEVERLSGLNEEVQATRKSLSGVVNVIAKQSDEILRLRGLVKSAECCGSLGPIAFAACPWCGAGYIKESKRTVYHGDFCPAFTPEGEVK